MEQGKTQRTWHFVANRRIVVVDRVFGEPFTAPHFIEVWMKANTDYEQALWGQGYKLIAGCDEAGTGSLIGDAYTACVVFPRDLDYMVLLPGLNDSKQLTPERRDLLYPLIKQHALAWAVDSTSVEEIAELNIYWAKWASLRRALNKLSLTPDHILMDGNKVIPGLTTPQMALVKGDAKSVSIAAASVLAKVDRDRYVVELAKQVDAEWGWADNKGYCTAEHLAALKKYGKTVYHRSKFVEKFV